MNLYDLHDKPEELHKHKEADKEVPQHFWDKYAYRTGNDDTSSSDLKAREDAIAKSPKHAYEYAKDFLKKRFPKGEAAILKKPTYAYLYAMQVIKGEWPEAEDAIVKSESPYFMAQYAILCKKRFPKAEPFILKSKDWGINYVVHIIKDRWPALEKQILSNKGTESEAVAYAERILKKPWPEAEKLISGSTAFTHAYLKAFPERKDAIAKLKEQK